MSLVGKYLVLWLAPEGIESFLGILDPKEETGWRWCSGMLTSGRDSSAKQLRPSRGASGWCALIPGLIPALRGATPPALATAG
jgi:hypothetical protein